MSLNQGLSLNLWLIHDGYQTSSNLSKILKLIYSKIIICLSVFQEQIFYYKLGNQMTPFFHEHESITFMSKEAFHKQIFHHKLSNLMASFFHDHEPITFMAKEVFYQRIFHHKLCNLMALT